MPDMQTDFVVRDASPDDAEAVARIYIDSWNAGFGHLMGKKEFDSELIERWRGAGAGERLFPVHLQPVGGLRPGTARFMGLSGSGRAVIQPTRPWAKSIRLLLIPTTGASESAESSCGVLSNT